MDFKTLIKKWWFWVIVIVIIGGIGTAVEPQSGNTEDNEPKQTGHAEKQEMTPKEYSNTIEGTIEKSIDEKYEDTVLQRITINDNLETEDNPYDKVVLVYLSWQRKNSESTAREVLRLYCDDLAATLASESQVSELAIFWEVPYLNSNKKCSYARSQDGMYLTDLMGI